MQSEVQLLINESEFLTEANAQSSGIGGCLGIRVFEDITPFLGNTVEYNDAIYGTVIRPYSIFTPWNGVFMILQLSGPCIPYTFSSPGTVKLYNNTFAYLDLYPLESISQNYTFQDVGNFSALGDFTREFRIPASDRNVQALGLLDSFTFSEQGNVYQKRISAEIRVDTLPISRGHLRVLKTFKQNDMLADIQVCFYGESPDLFRAIGDKLLKDIQYLPELNTLFTYEFITNGTNDICLGLVDRGQNWDETGSPNSRPVLNSEMPLYAADFTPFINAYTLFEKIITEAGFNLSPTPLATILAGYWVPWLNSRDIRTEETLGDIYFNAGYTTNTPLTDDNFYNFAELVDNGNNYATGAFTAPFDGYFTFRFWAHLQPVGTFGANVGGVKFYKYTGAPSTTNMVVNFEVAISGADQNNGNIVPVLFTTTPIYMAQGETIKPYTEFNGTPIFQGSVTNDPNAGTGWELFNYYRNYGSTIDVPANSPNIKQIDYIRDVLNMHAAVIVPSRTTPNELAIIPINDYIGSGSTVDWTLKLDISKDQTLSPTTDLQKRNFLFSYKAGSEAISKLYTDQKRTYGQYEILNGYTVNSNTLPNEFASGDFKLTLTAESCPADYIAGTPIPVPKFINDKKEFITPNLRFLFLADVATVRVYDDVALDVKDTAVNIFNHYSSVNASVGDYDLNFAPEQPLHTIITNPFRNLFNEYWREYLNGLYNPDARILEANFALDLTDIVSFKFSDRIFIKDSYWRILEISDYKVGLRESTKVKLMKLIQPAPDCTLVPVSVFVNEEATQIIEFENLAGEPAPANAICCERYGYTWSPELNQCISYGPPIIVDNPGPGGDSSAFMVNEGQNGRPSNVIAKTANTQIDVGNTRSVFAGDNITISAENSTMIAVGSKMELDGPNKGSALFGRNIKANLMGLHFGGGDRMQKDGTMQAGTVVFGNTGAFFGAGQPLQLVQGGDVLRVINLPDDTAWTCFYILHANDINGDFFYETGSFYIDKIGGVTAVNAPIVVSTANSGQFTFAFNIDIVTNPAEHRIIIISGGIGYPRNIQAVMTIYYNQTR